MSIDTSTKTRGKDERDEMMSRANNDERRIVAPIGGLPNVKVTCATPAIHVS